MNRILAGSGTQISRTPLRAREQWRELNSSKKLSGFHATTGAAGLGWPNACSRPSSRGQRSYRTDWRTTSGRQKDGPDHSLQQHIRSAAFGIAVVSPASFDGESKLYQLKSTCGLLAVRGKERQNPSLMWQPVGNRDLVDFQI